MSGKNEMDIIICRRTRDAVLVVIVVSPLLQHLLDLLSQFLTLVFQSQVWRSISKASPVGHFTDANRVMPFSPALSHLNLITKS